MRDKTPLLPSIQSRRRVSLPTCPTGGTMRAIGFSVAVLGLVLAGGLHAQQFMFQAPAPPARATGTMQMYGLGSGSYLGVGVAEVSAERVKALKLKEERGVEVTK